MVWTIQPSVAFNVFKIEETDGASKIQNIEKSRFVIMKGIKYSENAINAQYYSIDCAEATIRQDPTTPSRLILDVPISLNYPSQSNKTSYAIISIQKKKWKGKDDITAECYKPVKPFKYFKITVIASMYDDYGNFITKKHPTPYNTEGRTSIYRGKIAITGKFIVAQEIIEPSAAAKPSATPGGAKPASAKPASTKPASTRNKTMKTAMQAKKKA
jgi:hypothetical protein